jgi:hypothetical protein
VTIVGADGNAVIQNAEEEASVSFATSSEPRFARVSGVCLVSRCLVGIQTYSVDSPSVGDVPKAELF